MKKLIKCISVFILLFAILCNTFVPAQASGGITRIAGSNRYKTAYAVADTLKQTLGVEKFDNIVVASGTGFADALAGSYLAAVKRAPILLAHPQLMQDVAAYIRANLADGGTVYLLGGPAAVPADMESHLSGLNVQRLAGNNRYGTNLKILEAAGSDPTVLICTGKGFADSLSASAVGKPILLVSDRLTAEQKAFLAAEPRYSYIIGGKNAVNETIEAELAEFGDVIRLEGKNRFETSVMVADFNSPSDSAVLAYAANFPDGLCGGPLAYALGAPLLLTQSGRENIADTFATSRSITTGIILGGEGLISSDAAEKIFDGKSPCPHTATQLKNHRQATCIAEGYSGDTVCQDCGHVITAGKAIPMTDHNWSSRICTVCGMADPTSLFANDDYITAEPVSIDTGTLVYDIASNIYVPGNLESISSRMLRAMETTSGLSMEGCGLYANNTPDGKIHIQVTRDKLYESDKTGHTFISSEVGEGYAQNNGVVSLTPGDLFLSNHSGLPEMLSYELQYRQSLWRYSPILQSGFTHFTTYLTAIELEGNDPEAAFYLIQSQDIINNHSFWDMVDAYGILYSQPLEYWFENTFHFAGNGNASIGFRFMWYLHDVYGDYGKWRTDYENQHSFAFANTYDPTLSAAAQIQILKDSYGADVLDNFYPWLQKNEAIFTLHPNAEYWDLTTIHKINWYPFFSAHDSVVRLERVHYQDLYINLETVYKYLLEYKRFDISDLTLYNPDQISIRLFYQDGTAKETSATYISIQNVSYIQLIGSGSFRELEIEGFSPICTHANTQLLHARDATCAAPGYTGNTFCADCGSYLAYGEAIPQLPHNLVNGTCTNCTMETWTCNHADLHMENAALPSLTADGYTGDCICTLCGEVIVRGYPVHNYSNRICSGCGKEALVCDHPITYMVNVHDATCTTDGYLGDCICVSCGEPKQIGYWVEKYHMWDGEKCTVCGIAQPY